MKKYFVVADVHGHFDELMEALTNAGFDKDNPAHVFVSCGDLLDRGNQPIECLQFVNSLPEDRKILVRGNHETLMEQMAQNGAPGMHDFHNGTIQTAAKLAGITPKTPQAFETICDTVFMNEELDTYYKSLVHYGEVGDYIFTHGWLPEACDEGGHTIIPDDWRDGDWKEAEWLNGMEEWHFGIIIPGKTIVCGHFHVGFGHKRYHKTHLHEVEYKITEPFIDEGIVALDACTAENKVVNCFTFEYEEEDDKING